MESLQNLECHTIKSIPEGKTDKENDINVEVNHKGRVAGSPFLLFNISSIHSNKRYGSYVKNNKRINEENKLSSSLTNQLDSKPMSNKNEKSQTNCVSQTPNIHSYEETSSCPIKVYENDKFDQKHKSFTLKNARSSSNDTAVNESQNIEICESKFCTDDIKEEQIEFSKEPTSSENNDDENFNYRPSFTKRITIERLTWLPQPPKLSNMKFFSYLEDAFRYVTCRRRYNF